MQPAALSVEDKKIQEELQALVEPLLTWYDRGHRILPWREKPDAYRVWISEIMLQQTRVEAVRPYYDRFLQAFPNVSRLADAPEEEVLKLWEGLGYYSRARNLKKAATQIRERYGGVIPDTYEALLQLPGIGSYTAGAIASIAFGRRFRLWTAMYSAFWRGCVWMRGILRNSGCAETYSGSSLPLCRRRARVILTRH